MRLEIGLPDRERNRILGALPEPVYRRLLPELSFVSLEVTDVLFEPGQEIGALYFPVDGVVSLVTPLEDGQIVEVATIGNEGIVGVPLGSGGAPATVRAISQVAGASLRIGTDVFTSAVAKDGPFGTLVRSYEQALFSQIAQAAACNRLHSNEERLSRWLLMSHDRVGRDEFAITQEFLAQMLGSRRATVTLSAGILQRAGLIRYRRGHMIIVDREGLEGASCECYRTIKDTLDRVLTSPGRNGHQR
jgi:CRP-like cAMP-binding protein